MAILVWGGGGGGRGFGGEGSPTWFVIILKPPWAGLLNNGPGGSSPGRDIECGPWRLGIQGGPSRAGVEADAAAVREGANIRARCGLPA